MKKSEKVEFNGVVLKRGFWLYVCKINYNQMLYIYVGRTGDSSSSNAASFFNRISKHLEERENAKSNALRKNLSKQGINVTQCQYQFLGFLINDESKNEYKERRDEIAAMEKQLYNDLEKDYPNQMLGNVKSNKVIPKLLEEQYNNILEQIKKFLEQ